MISAFGVDHGGEFSKATDKEKKTAAAAGGTAAVGAAALNAKIPEHSHYDKKTRKHIQSLSPGVHEVDTKMLAKKPRKLGARKQQAPYVAAMAQERPQPYSPVPITRYKDGVIQRDNAHSVMANAMKGRKTLVKIEDADGYRPTRRAGEELVRRAQGRYQQHRLKRHMDLPEKKIESIRSQYKPKSRKANTSKRPHGVVEEGVKMNTQKPSLKRVVTGGKNLKLIAKADKKKDTASGAIGAAGVGVLGTTPVRRSASKVDIKNGQMKSKDAAKVLNPGYRPGNKKAIQTMAANLGHLEKEPTRVIRYKDGKVIPYDGNHRGTARVARGDKKIPVSVIEGGERPSVSVTRNAYHVGQQRLHQARMKRGDFNATAATGKHTGERKAYSFIANSSAARSGKRVAVGSTKAGSGPTKAVLRTKQGLTVGAGAALLGTSAHLSRKKD